MRRLSDEARAAKQAEIARDEARKRKEQWEQQQQAFKDLVDQLKQHVQSLEFNIRSVGAPVPPSSTPRPMQPQIQLVNMIVTSPGAAPQADILAPDAPNATAASTQLQTISQLQARVQQLQEELQRVQLQHNLDIQKAQPQPADAGLQVSDWMWLGSS